jgi:hypothetical protein
MRSPFRRTNRAGQPLSMFIVNEPAELRVPVGDQPDTAQPQAVAETAKPLPEREPLPDGVLGYVVVGVRSKGEPQLTHTSVMDHGEAGREARAYEQIALRRLAGQEENVPRYLVYELRRAGDD